MAQMNSLGDMMGSFLLFSFVNCLHFICKVHQGTPPRSYGGVQLHIYRLNSYNYLLKFSLSLSLPSHHPLFHLPFSSLLWSSSTPPPVTFVLLPTPSPLVFSHFQFNFLPMPSMYYFTFGPTDIYIYIYIYIYIKA